MLNNPQRVESFNPISRRVNGAHNEADELQLKYGFQDGKIPS